jgi:Polyketide cyclase / dehydrase and lipid transport.
VRSLLAREEPCGKYEYSLETSADREALWHHWADMAAWPQWNDGIETIDVDGPFAVGTTFTMTPPGDEPIRMRLVEIEPGTSFTDEMDAGTSWCGPSTGWSPRPAA